MSRITHYKNQPKNIMYWDYYILCHLNIAAATALQRIEYWDGTKKDGNVHGENINDILEESGQKPTQDTSRWIYKAQDELLWELMTIAGEKALPVILEDLKEQGYLKIQNNPNFAFDRKRQYCFNDKPVQEHVSYLGYIIESFNRAGFKLDTVYYAIEQLTSKGRPKEKAFSELHSISIENLSIDNVVTMLTDLQRQCDKDELGLQDKTCKPPYKPILPAFLRRNLKKDKKRMEGLSKISYVPFRRFAEWKTANCGMDSDQMENGFRPNADAIPITTNSEYEQEREEDTAQSPNGDVCSSVSPPSVNTQEDEPSLPPDLQSTIDKLGSKRSNPRPPSPTEEKKPPAQKPGRKPKGLTDTELAVLEKWDSLHACPVDSTDRDIKGAASYFARMIDQGHITLDILPQVRTKILENPFWQNNLTFPQFKRLFSTHLTSLKVTYQEDTDTSSENASKRYNDPNFDPRTLSNTESIEYNAWLNAHQPAS